VREEVECKARVESQQVEEETAKQRVVEVAAKQKMTVQEVLKKRARDEPEASPVGEVQYVSSYFISAFVLLISFCRCMCCAKHCAVCVTTVTSDHPVPYCPIASTHSSFVYCMYSLFCFSLSVL